MSYEYSAKSKQQKHPKVDYQEYLYNSGEPPDDISHDTPVEIEAELLENSFFMKRRIRRTAQKIRTASEHIPVHTSSNPDALSLRLSYRKT